MIFIRKRVEGTYHTLE
ncbi:unnamed protein product, partial [Allacma fusca]